MNIDIYWLWLVSLKKLSNQKKLALIDAFKTPERIFNANEEELCTIRGIREKDIVYIKKEKNLKLAEKAESFMKKHEIHLVTLKDALYPERLKNIYNPPIAFFAKGNLSMLERDLYLGIVGSRKASPGGLNKARKFAEMLSEAGFTIVSGLAEGIDAQSHEGSIDHIGSTIAVMGTGINVCYPDKNKALYRRIVEKGLIITEFFIDEKPLAFHFPLRNRLISGLSDGLLVVEARDKSGALITANHALEQGKNVYAIPGDISIYQSVGSNQMLKDGAKVVTCPEDILEDFIIPEKLEKDFHNSTSVDRAIEKVEDPEMARLMRFIAEGVNTLDMLCVASGLSARELNAKLSLMELDDLVKIEFGQIYLL